MSAGGPNGGHVSHQQVQLCLATKWGQAADTTQSVRQEVVAGASGDVGPGHCRHRCCSCLLRRRLLAARLGAGRLPPKVGVEGCVRNELGEVGGRAQRDERHQLTQVWVQ